MKLLRLAHAGGMCVRLAVLAVAAYGLVHAAHLAMSVERHAAGRELALLAAGYAVLAALVVVLCLRREMRLKLFDYPVAREEAMRLKQIIDYGPAGGDERASWVKKAVKDVLVDLLVFVFFFRVAELVPPPVSVLVWGFMAIFTCACVYMLSFCDDQHWRDKAALGGVDSKKAVQKIRPADEKIEFSGARFVAFFTNLR
ncbi:hypothetical protein EJB05_28755 [Eragrostis curvula]|uniref:Uncharacterized protein n=1 Tax=Eragrostis curvula TaxID=38414 RepID=A0A5J9USB2_9POAL|nr:hypothetical protein EJB05_28755 [Eragrostis curvula]